MQLLKSASIVRSVIDHSWRSSPVAGQEAMAVAVLLQMAEALQTNIKVAIKENAGMLDRFMPLADLILDWVINKSLVRSILQVIDEDGSVKDSASGKLKQARWRVLNLENKVRTSHRGRLVHPLGMDWNGVESILLFGRPFLLWNLILEGF